MVLYIQAQCLMTIRAESMSLVIIKAEGARLESVFRVKPNEGSNPSLSAKFNTNPLILLVGFLFTHK